MRNITVAPAIFSLFVIFAMPATASSELAMDGSPRSCGVICARYLLARYDFDVPYDEVDRRIKCSNDGTASMLDIDRCLVSYGLRTRAIAATVDDLKVLPFPLLLLMKSVNESAVGHFVIGGWNSGRKQFEVLDLTNGQQHIYMSDERFQELWTGNAMSVAPPSLISGRRGAVVWGAVTILGILIWLGLKKRQQYYKRCFPKIPVVVPLVFIGALLVGRNCLADPVGDVLEKNLGVVDASDLKLVTQLDWTNSLAHTVQISNIMTSCACTTVTSSRSVIQPGERVVFKTEVDLREQRGYSVASFLVVFSDEKISPLHFKLAFFTRSALVPQPTHVSFGVIDDPLRAKRTFAIKWVAASPSERISTSVGPFTSTGKVANASIIEERESAEQSVGAEKEHIVQEYVFETTLAEDVPIGEYRDEFIIPFKLLGEEFNVHVPLEGYFGGEVQVSPNAVIAFERPSNGNMEYQLSVQRKFDRLPVRKLVAKSDNGAVSAIFEPSSTADDNELGYIRLHIDSAASIESKICLQFQAGERLREIFIPIRIVRLP